MGGEMGEDAGFEIFGGGEGGALGGRNCGRAARAPGGGVVEGLGGGEVVAVAEAVEVAAGDGEKREAAVEFGELVEVDREEENPVNEAVLARREARVEHRAFVETGVHSSGRRF